MKKLVLAVAAVLATMTLNAQEESYKPGAGAFQMEVGFSPFTLTAAGQDAVSLQGGQIKAAYSITDNIGVRLGLGFGMNSNSTNNGETGDALATTKTSTTNFSIAPGFTYSFNGTKKLSPYVGLEVPFGTTSTKTTAQVGDVKTVTTNGGFGTQDFLNNVGVNVFTGFNFYFSKNIYAGIELGLGFTSTWVTEGKTEITGVPGWTAPDALKNKESDVNFRFYANPAFRLGWAF